MTLTLKGTLIMKVTPEWHEEPIKASQIAKQIPELNVFQVAPELSWNLVGKYVELVYQHYPHNNQRFKSYRKKRHVGGAW